MSKGHRAPKSYWHPLSLQQLAPHQLISVVNGILDGRHTLVSYTLRRTPDAISGPLGLLHHRHQA
jgi:hypothetical protein